MRATIYREPDGRISVTLSTDSDDEQAMLDEWLAETLNPDDHPGAVEVLRREDGAIDFEPYTTDLQRRRYRKRHT